MVLGKWRKRKRRNLSYAYSAWDGTQTGFDISAEDLLAELGDDLCMTVTLIRLCAE